MANSYTSIFIHIIFSTHNREPLLQSGFRNRLFAYLGGIARENKIKATSIGGVMDPLSFLQEYNIEYDEKYVWG
jgi:putative transposase